MGPHGNQATRRALGLEAALVDRGLMVVSALDPGDPRLLTVDVTCIIRNTSAAGMLCQHFECRFEAARALSIGIPEDRVEAICVAYVAGLRAA